MTFNGPEFGDITKAFNNATMPTGENVSLTTGTGVMAFAGHCDAHPTENYSVVMADIVVAAGDPTCLHLGRDATGGIWGYADANINATIARDYAMCFGVGGQFLLAGGGDDTYLGGNPASINATRLHGSPVSALMTTGVNAPGLAGHNTTTQPASSSRQR